MPKKIAVLKVPARAFDPSRPPSNLLLSQVEQLQTAVMKAIDSEGEAAACIRTLTILLEELRPQITPCAHKDAPRPSRRRSASRKNVRHATKRRRPATRAVKKR